MSDLFTSMSCVSENCVSENCACVVDCPIVLFICSCTSAVCEWRNVVSRGRRERGSGGGGGGGSGFSDMEVEWPF